jgi:amino acid transporter
MKNKKIREIILGKALDPMKSETRHSMALVAFLAWVGLGADGLSSSSYGPEETFRALGAHTHLGLYMALATAVTVFVIAIAYNQVIELFPTGGGGYRVATKLVGPYFGLVSGCALILDYVLTIAISIASGVDALASFLPLGFQPYKLWAEAFFVAALIIMNLRGLKEAIQILLPIFLGFVATHLVLIVYGIVAHASHLPQLIPSTIAETTELAGSIGWTSVAGMLLLAYSQGGGTYTGLEAVSNNVNLLAEPRVRTGKVTMLYMALSLAFTAGGIILLYLLWDARSTEGETLNASTFKIIIGSMGLGGPMLRQVALAVVLAFEAGLLFVAANTGFLGGPSVLSNMASDSWVPHQFRYLSSRLVKQNGILVMGIAALAILFWTGGRVTLWLCCTRSRCSSPSPFPCSACACTGGRAARTTTACAGCAASCCRWPASSSARASWPYCWSNGLRRVAGRPRPSSRASLACSSSSATTTAKPSAQSSRSTTCSLPSRLAPRPDRSSPTRTRRPRCSSSAPRVAAVCTRCCGCSACSRATSRISCS